MALSPSAQALKDRRNKKMAPPAEAEAPETEDKGGKVDEGMSMDEMLEDLGGETETGAEAPEIGKPDMEEGAPEAGADDGVKVFADVLDLDDVTAEAVYAEAMAMPELAEKSPEDMAKAINGNYAMLKKILMSMGEKAAAVMQSEMNAPMDLPEDMGTGDGAPV